MQILHFEELDIRGTELSAETISSLLNRLNHLRWLDASWLENFTDHVRLPFVFCAEKHIDDYALFQVLDLWMQSGKINTIVSADERAVGRPNV